METSAMFHQIDAHSFAEKEGSTSVNKTQVGILTSSSSTTGVVSNKKSGMKIAHAHGRGVTFSLGCMQEKFFAVSLVDHAREWKASRGTSQQGREHGVVLVR